MKSASSDGSVERCRFNPHLGSRVDHSAEVKLGDDSVWQRYGLRVRQFEHRTSLNFCQACFYLTVIVALMPSKASFFVEITSSKTPVLTG